MQITQIIFLVVIVASFYFLLIRPQQQQAKKQAELVASLEPGALIMTIGGLYATVVEVEDDRVRVAVADGSEMEFAKRAIASIVTAAPDLEGEESDEEPPMEDDSHGPEDAGLAEKDDASHV